MKLTASRELRTATLLPRRTLLALSLFAFAGCEREAQIADVPRSTAFFLEENYPQEFRTAEITLSGALIARGDSLYKGVIGAGACNLCHGPFLRGGDEYTNLRDGRWHNGDGSYRFIVSTIIGGIARPDRMSMPPGGGMQLSDADVRAIAAYVYWYTRDKRWPRDTTALAASQPNVP